MPEIAYASKMAEKSECHVLDVSDDGYLSLMDDGGNTRDDLKNPDGELGEEIKGAIGDGKDILVRIDGALLCWDSL